MKQHLQYFCLGLKQKTDESDSQLFALFDGEQFVFEESDYKYLDMVKLFWRYGLQLYFLKGDVKTMLDRFSK